ncbi:MAG: non-canonical purine NTP diphosphatase [Flavobacteriaceae bacterium]|nr:non-canonical purine NTP diphosphatase [Flavobacteriaceae bacterium]
MQLVFATNNLNKLKEVKDLLPDFIELKSLSDINCFVEIPETATTLEENAILKANFVTQQFQMNCFADDTGLEVESLNGAPGVYSARYAGEEANPFNNIEKLLFNLKDKSNRKAQFRTVIALNLSGKQYLFEGVCKGKIIEEERGNEGFGYDPIFIPDGYSKTFAEMNLEEKGKISHRGKAIQQLVQFLNSL